MRAIHDYDSFTDALLEKAYQQGLRDGRATKPLRWRTGQVPEGEAVFFEYFLDGFGTDYGVGDGAVDGGISGDINVDWQDAKWLPLSEILDLIGE